jgi:23S rRNA pseudouridine1911/1915/1917 synthase
METLTILHAGPGYVVINKPAGIATEKNFDNDTVEARAQVQWKGVKRTKTPFVGIVHRLDRPVSGVLLLAKNKSTLRLLNKAFEDKLVRKTYLALTDAALPNEVGMLQHFLARDPTGRSAVATAGPAPGAKKATLEYRLIGQRGGGFLYELSPLTGRFHQIRVQLSTAGAPIVGDAAYGSTRPFKDNQICLHASRLAFPDPAGEGECVVEVRPDW